MKARAGERSSHEKRSAPFDDRNVGRGLPRPRPEGAPFRGEFRPARLGLKPQAIQISPLRGAGGDKPLPYVSIARALFFVFLLPLPRRRLAPLPEQKAAIAALPDTYRAFLAEVEILLSDQERATFLALAKDYQRDAFIKQFWEVRDTVQRTARNEFHESWESNLQQAKRAVRRHQRRPHPRAPAQRPARRAAGVQLLADPLSRSRSGSTIRSRATGSRSSFVLYRKWGAGPFRLWEPSEGIDVLFTARERSARPGALAGRDRQQRARPAAARTSTPARSSPASPGSSATGTGTMSGRSSTSRPSRPAASGSRPSIPTRPTCRRAPLRSPRSSTSPSPAAGRAGR